MRPLAGRRFAAAPKAQAFGLVLAHADGCGARRAQHLAHAANFFFHLFGRAVAFAQQDGFGTQVIACVHKVFHGGGHGLVHHLRARRG